MSDIDVLQELIDKQALVPLEETPCGKKAVDLVERDIRGKILYSIKIKGVPNDTVVVKTDKFSSPEEIFACLKGECKRADYVIIANSGKANFIIYVELKKGRGNIGKIINQLKGSECFISYCRAIVCKFWQQSDFLDQYENRFVTFRRIGNRKFKTRINPLSVLHDTPERMLRISDVNDREEVPFRRLIQGSS